MVILRTICCFSVFTACFGAWDLGPQHGFARISKWNCSKSPTTVSQKLLTLIDFYYVVCSGTRWGCQCHFHAF